MPIFYPAILAVDVGQKTSGFAYIDAHGDMSSFFETKGYLNFYKKIYELTGLYKINLMVVGKPNRFYNVIAGQSKLIGVACLIAEKRNVALVEINDSTARAKLFPGKGNAKKEVIKQEFPGMQEDAMDALVLAKASWLLFNS